MRHNLCKILSSLQWGALVVAWPEDNADGYGIEDGIGGSTIPYYHHRSYVPTYTWPSTQTFSILVSQRIHKLQMCGAQGADRNCLANAQLLPTNLQAIRVSTEITIISTDTHTHILGQQQLLLPLHVLVAPCRCCCSCCCSSYPCSCSCCCRPVVLRSFVCNLMRAFS